MDARKSEEYQSAKTHVSRLLAQGRRSRIRKGYDRSEHECLWFMDLLYDMIKDVMQVKQQQHYVVQDDDSNSNDSNSCDSNEKDQDNQGNQEDSSR